MSTQFPYCCNVSFADARVALVVLLHGTQNHKQIAFVLITQTLFGHRIIRFLCLMHSPLTNTTEKLS